jgi:hypothetical protein
MSPHTLLWILRDNHCVATDCEAWSDGGAAHVVLRHDGKPDMTTDFPDTTEAVRWAFSLERTLLQEGWTKVV